MRVLTAIKYSKLSLRAKLFAYMFILATLLLLALVSGMLIFGQFDSIGESTYESLDVQMEWFQRDVSTHFDRLAAAGIDLSKHTGFLIDNYLSEKGLSFDDLNDSASDIKAIQNAMMHPLQQSLRQENCSGVFVMLEATVNSAVKDAELSRTGIYLQQSGYKTPDKSILLYRGLVEAGKAHQAMPHRKWQLEFRSDRFPNYDKIAAFAKHTPERAYFVTDRISLPGTSESAMFIVSPVVSKDGTFYGICGYEVSYSFFRTYYAQPSKIKHLTCLMVENGGDVLNTSSGFSCGVFNGYYREPKGILNIKQENHGLLSFINDDVSYIGVAREAILSPNNAPHMLVVTMLKSDYDRAVIGAIVRNVILMALLLFFAISCCMIFSRRYLSPILKGLEQIKLEDRSQAQSTIPEINDLFVFLSEQDQRYEDSLNALTKEKQTAQSEKNHLQVQFEQAQIAFESAQDKYQRAQQELSTAKTELDRLAYSRKNEIDPDDFQHFKEGLGTLTKMERVIFDYYLDGKSAQDILELTGIKHGTLKFHNHNIIGKLGVSSRKQMLRFAALMKQSENDQQ
ncbi:MAG: hypothetical protein J6L81_05405 [Clostridia bacterium]|nr:hypothetical protein [Clostridia bacterium]